jgi:hypothetical protein
MLINLQPEILDLLLVPSPLRERVRVRGKVKKAKKE